MDVPAPRSCIVDLGLFSGRPDPRFTLDAAEVAELERRVEALAPAAERVDAEPLGYRGFTVDCGPGAMRIRIAFGFVTGSKGPHFDTDRVLERWLLARAALHLDAQTIAFARAQFER